MESLIAYDPGRVRALALRTEAVIRWLDERNSDEPAAHGAVATLRTVSHVLGTTWTPWFTAALGDTSMIDWDADGPWSGSSPAATASAFRSPAGSREIAAEMAELAELVAGKDLDALAELSRLIAEHGDDPVVMAEFARQLGPDDFEALVVLLASGEVFPLGPTLATAEAAAARDAVLNALCPPQPQWLTDPDFSLAESVVPGGPAAADELNPGCVNWAGGSYGGGGCVIGPDGRSYPIAIPTVTVDGTVYTGDYGDPDGVSVDDLGGTDPGWEIVCYQSGVERFQEPAGLDDQVLGFLAGTTGLVSPLPGNSGLQFISMQPRRLPALAGTPEEALPIDAPPSDGAPDPADTSTSAVVTSIADATITAGQGWVFAASMDSQRQRAYQVVFEQNGDRRRARIETFTLGYDENGSVVIIPEHVYVNDEGRLISQLITYPPTTNPSGMTTSVTDASFAPHESVTAYEVRGAVFP